LGLFEDDPASDRFKRLSTTLENEANAAGEFEATGLCV
jgi:hypothetical protein